METIYVLKDVLQEAKNCYVEIDKASGGYPYLTDLINSHRFYSLDSINEYMKMFKDEPWEIEVLIYYTEKLK